ncbi:MAG TPA: sulfurtransferase [Gammaproteobacteria bacterium]|jgi:thiosulfate/3-mercaptopyruvate sulfurtransferase|nr:sulfurtransferase [Gammaproteobacteria bacterium]
MRFPDDGSDYTVSMFDTLVETETLAAHIDDPAWVLFDCRASLADQEAGPRSYAAGHIPGARHMHLERELSGPVTPDTGRHPLPDPRSLAETLGCAGVDADIQIVAYDDMQGAYAARLWWLTRWLGHTRVAVLNGGWQQWLREERPISQALPTHPPRQFPFKDASSEAWIHVADVLELVRGRKRGLLLDARSPARFRGEEETIDPVAGHVPGAVSLPFAGNVAEDGRFKSPAELRRRYEQVMQGLRPGQVICMCGSGVTACHDLLAMEAAGLKGARLYAGSWSEWIHDPTRPIASGG